MSVIPVGSNPLQNTGSLLLQQLTAANGTSSQTSTSATDLLGDLLTLSPASQQLAQAPTAVTQAMTDLLSGQNDIQGDLTKLKTYFQANPQSLASVLSSLQGGAGAYGVSNSLGSNSALLTALMNGQSNASNPANLLSLLKDRQGQDSLFAMIGDPTSGTNSSPSSLFG